jgi:hypothetical protein
MIKNMEKVKRDLSSVEHIVAEVKKQEKEHPDW